MESDMGIIVNTIWTVKPDKKIRFHSGFINEVACYASV
jgi:hypothetical protein